MNGTVTGLALTFGAGALASAALASAYTPDLVGRWSTPGGAIRMQGRDRLWRRVRP